MELSEIELHRLCFMWRDVKLQHYIKEFYRYYLKFKNEQLQSAIIYNKFSCKKQILNEKDLPLCFNAICNIINNSAGKMIIAYSKNRIFWL